MQLSRFRSGCRSLMRRTTGSTQPLRLSGSVRTELTDPSDSTTTVRRPLAGCAGSFRTHSVISARTGVSALDRSAAVSRVRAAVSSTVSAGVSCTVAESALVPSLGAGWELRELLARRFAHRLVA